ncbi:MAG TPA: hypothetical protein GXZ23_03980 [Clostridiales bacterium]|nr:hypothetical protein [Clostridiales bacterium]
MLNFKNGKFIIMQVTDVQDMHYVRKTCFKMLEKAYDMVKPDLIVLTGDNVLGNHLKDARFGNKIVVKDKSGEYKRYAKALDFLCKPISKRNIPFAFLFGNHDDFNLISKDEIANLYRTYKGLVSYKENSFCDCGTYSIPIYDEKRENIKFFVYMIDSARYDKENDKCYQEITKETLDWLREETKKNKDIPAILFQHIPLKEELNLIEECENGNILEDGKRYKLKDNASGELLEYPSVCESGEEFEIIKNSNIKACAFGHDHKNAFIGRLDNIDLIQTPCASFRCYGTKNRGVRIFEIEEKTGNYNTYLLNMNDLLGNSLCTEIRYFWDADENEKKKRKFLIGMAVASAITVIAGICAKIIQNRKN